MANSVVDEFCINEEVRVRRFGTKMADKDPRARALIEIAERLKNLANAHGAPEMTDAQWGARLLDKIIAEANQRGIKLPFLLSMIAGMCGNIIASSAPHDSHAALLAFAQGAVANALEHEVAHAIPAGATVQ